MATSPTESYASFFGIPTKSRSNSVNTEKNDSNTISHRDEKLEIVSKQRTDSNIDTSNLNDLNLQPDRSSVSHSVTEFPIQQSSTDFDEGKTNDVEEYAHVESSHKLSPPVGSYSDEKSCQDSVYSDEFESDSLPSNVKTAKKKLTKYRRQSGNESAGVNKSRSLLRNSMYFQLHGKQNSKSQRSSQASRSNFSTGPQERNYVTQRLLSARRLKINELRNELEDTQRQVREVEQENRFLKRLQLKQERDLARLQNSKGELPEMLQSHSEEVRVLKKLLSKAKEKIK
ncbi:lebercilin-like [Limulus polyphemus]|uniref:Lebercilin-like n=1 Tax=Limulus polyphemus TaxID=6850 RepID=A0ABM1TNR9_LIMPO|nr:lebercilin-like [Limulus polyphemus]